jgi:hypothetical protein
MQMIFCEVQWVNHGLKDDDVGKVFHCIDKKLLLVPSEVIAKKHYGDWTIISSVVDADNFKCFSGEIYILERVFDL